MADDIFLSPEEQDERARKWAKDNLPALAIGVALGLAGVVGYNKYQDNIQLQAESASALFRSASIEAEDSGLANIDEQVSQLKENHAATSYAAKAVLLKAKQTALNDLSAAYTELQWVVDNASEFGLVHTARLRQAKIKLAQNELDDAKTLASHTPVQGFDSHYQEILGDIAVRSGDETQARVHYQAAMDALNGTQDTYVQVLSIKLDRLPAQELEESAQDVTSSVSDDNS